MRKAADICPSLLLFWALNKPLSTDANNLTLFRVTRCAALVAAELLVPPEIVSRLRTERPRRSRAHYTEQQSGSNKDQATRHGSEAQRRKSSKTARKTPTLRV